MRTGPAAVTPKMRGPAARKREEDGGSCERQDEDRLDLLLSERGGVDG
jgi:hypothetical protein